MDGPSKASYGYTGHGSGFTRHYKALTTLTTFGTFADGPARRRTRTFKSDAELNLHAPWCRGPGKDPSAQQVHSRIPKDQSDRNYCIVRVERALSSESDLVTHSASRVERV